MIYRLENLSDGINLAYEACGIEKRLTPNKTKLNKNPSRRQYKPTRTQMAKLETIYAKDFELYEEAE